MIPGKWLIKKARYIYVCCKCRYHWPLGHFLSHIPIFSLQCHCWFPRQDRSLGNVRFSRNQEIQIQIKVGNYSIITDSIFGGVYYQPSFSNIYERVPSWLNGKLHTWLNGKWKIAFCGNETTYYWTNETTMAHWNKSKLAFINTISHYIGQKTSAPTLFPSLNDYRYKTLIADELIRISWS